MMQYISTSFTLSLCCLMMTTCNKEKVFSGNNTNKDRPQAGMVVTDGHLFLADNNALAIYSLQQPAAPVLAARNSFTSYFDSVFLYSNELAVTRSYTMQLYNIADPANITSSGSLALWTNCDHVFTSRQTACVLRSGNIRCDNDSIVRIYDISTPLQPLLKSSFWLRQPQALAMAAGNALYVCDRKEGLVVADISNPAAPVIVKTFSDDSYYDLALNGRLLLCRGARALSCYDVSNPLDPVLVSKLFQ